MSVLVTGAMGQVGKRVVEILLDRGVTVVALDLETPSSIDVLRDLQAPRGGSGQLIPAFVDLTDNAAVARLVAEQRPVAIVHLAAIVSPTCYRNPQLARRVNVEGTRHLVEAAKRLPVPPLFIKASSCAVYGSRNPYRHPERVDDRTAVNPVDCYGEDKVAAEELVAQSDLPFALMRLGGVISPDAMGTMNSDYLVLIRATPRDNRVHAVDARDAALAFANAVDRGSQIDGKVLLVGGNDSYALTQEQLQDGVMKAMGMGRLGAAAGLLGDPGDDRGWGLTDWFDTREAQALLDFQKHDWTDTVAWIAAAPGTPGPVVRFLSPVLRALLSGFLAAQRKWEGRGRYADPWSLIARRYGPQILARQPSVSSANPAQS